MGLVGFYRRSGRTAPIIPLTTPSLPILVDDNEFVEHRPQRPFPGVHDKPLKPVMS
jgi:hypothetical protein